MGSATKIKICGLTKVEEVRQAEDLAIDAIGLNFVPASVRFLELEKARALVQHISSSLQTVGVFVNTPIDELLRIVDTLKLSAVQLHGDEDEEYCHRLKGITRYKAFRVREGSNMRATLDRFNDVVEYYVFDSFSPNAYGGTGKEIPNSVVTTLSHLPELSRSFLSGGLTPDNVAQKIAQIAPYGVDIASGVENTPGCKCLDLMSLFVKRVRGVT